MLFNCYFRQKITVFCVNSSRFERVCVYIGEILRRFIREIQDISQNTINASIPALNARYRIPRVLSLLSECNWWEQWSDSQRNCRSFIVSSSLFSLSFQQAPWCSQMRGGAYAERLLCFLSSDWSAHEYYYKEAGFWGMIDVLSFPVFSSSNSILKHLKYTQIWSIYHKLYFYDCFSMTWLY